MDSMNLHEVVTELIGPIQPVGETNADAQRFENLKVAIDLVERLLFDIDCVSWKAGAPESSIQKSAQAAYKFMQAVRDA